MGEVHRGYTPTECRHRRPGKAKRAQRSEGRTSRERPEALPLCPRDLSNMANEYLDQHCAELFAETWQRVQNSFELRKLYDREQRKLGPAMHRACGRGLRTWAAACAMLHVLGGMSMSYAPVLARPVGRTLFGKTIKE